MIALALIVSGCSAESLFTRVHPAMGTDFTLYIYAADAAAADREAERVFAIVDQLDSLLSNYQPQSELSRINHEAADRAVTTDPETFRFVQESLAWSARSDGAFDITVGKLMKAWGFFRSTGHVPSHAELTQVRAETGWKRVVLDAGTRTVRFTSPGVELDTGGIGKGFAVDAVVKALRADGVRAALFSAGSSTIYGMGAPPDEPGWKVRVPDPEHRGAAMSTFVLHDTRAAVEKIKQGKIGEPTHVYAYWHRNNDWRRPVPSADPGGKLEHLINWRLYRKTSGGLVTELGSHHIDIANWIFDAIPERATGMTSIVRYHDGRTVGDNVQAVFSYPGRRRLMFSSITDNAKMGNELWVYGTEGSVAITIEDATVYYEPKTHTPVVTGAEVAKHGIVTGASYATKGEMPYRGPGERLPVTVTEDPTLTACRAFIECVRAKRQPVANARVGYGSAIGAAIANRAVYEEEGIAVPPLPA
jgi:predicted dehydrogenase